MLLRLTQKVSDFCTQIEGVKKKNKKYKKEHVRNEEHACKTGDNHGANILDQVFLKREEICKITSKIDQESFAYCGFSKRETKEKK